MPMAVLQRWRWVLIAVMAAVGLVSGPDARADAYPGITSLIVGVKEGTGEQVLSAVAARLGARIVSHNTELGTAVMEVRPGTAGAVIEALERGGRVRYAGPNIPITITAAPPTDEYYRQGQQWNIDRVQAPQAWDLLPPGGNTIVAVIDSGIDYGHPEFEGRISRDGCDQFYGDCLGGGGGTLARDELGHGTHVAGIIGANTNNGIGVASVSGGRVTILPVKVTGRGTSLATADALDAITYAINKGAKVINMSFGGPCGEPPRGYQEAWRDALALAEQRDVLLVKAAGNDGGCWEGRYPETDSRVLSVAATDIADASPSFTSRGAWVKVAAPGDRILSTYPTGRGSYATLRGTSMATPHVAGQAALLFQVPGATKAKVMEWITSTCDTALVSVQCGGRINVYRSVHLAVKGVDPGKAPTSPADAPVSAPAMPGSAAGSPMASTPALPAGRFTPPALPAGFSIAGSASPAQPPARMSGTAANVAWNGAFWLSAPTVAVGVCTEAVSVRAAVDAALRLFAGAAARGLAWQIPHEDAACASTYTGPKLLITHETVSEDDAPAAMTVLRDITGAPCNLAPGTSGCWVHSGTITLSAGSFDQLSEEQQALTMLRELVHALGLSHAITCGESLLVSAEICPDARPADLGADDIASLNELLAVTLQVLRG